MPTSSDKATPATGLSSEPALNEHLGGRLGGIDSKNATDFQVLRASADKIRALVKTTVAAVVDAGNELIVVKEKVGHGNFKAWIESECGFSHSTALNYMRAAEFAKTKIATITLLNPRSVYMLAAPTAPKAAVAEIEARLSTGESFSDRKIADVLDQARYDLRQVEQMRRLEKLPAKKKKQRDERKLHEEQRKKEEAERVAKTASALIDGLGTDKCRILVDTLDDGLIAWEVMNELRRQIGGDA